MSDQNEPRTVPSNCKLGLRHGFRMQYEPAQKCDVLLFPEGMITLSASASEIMKLCDATRTADQIVAELEQKFPDANLRADVLEFLSEAWNKGWLSES